MLVKYTGRVSTARIAAALVLVLTGGLACGILDDGACPTWNPPVIRVDVVDAGSGRFVPHSTNPTGFTYRGRLRVREPMVLVVHPFPGPTLLEGGDGPPGARSEVFVYDVEITAEGYEIWRASDISVEVDNCGNARTVEMNARLLPSTPTG